MAPNAAIAVEAPNAIISVDMAEFVHIDMFEDEALLDNSSSQSSAFTLVGNNSGTHLTMKKRDSIKALRRYGNMPIWRIVHHMKLPYTTVWNVCNEPLTPQRGRGRPTVVTTLIRCTLVDCITSSAEGRQLSFKDLQQKLDLDISVSIIRRALVKEGFHRRLAIGKPFFSLTNIANRLAFATKYSAWDKADWSWVIFTDECAVQNGGNTRRGVTRRPGEEWLIDCMRPRFGKPVSCMVWGSITGHAVGPMEVWDKNAWGNINSAFFCQHILSSLHDFWLSCCDDWEGVYDGIIQVQMDKAPAHWALNTRNRITERGIPLLDWSGNSPDLNSIEGVWSIIKRRINRRVPKVLTKHQINVAITEE